MTIIALVIGFSLTLALIFFNFSFVLTLKLFREGSVAVGRYFFMLSVTGVNVGIIIWLGKALKLAQKPAKPAPTQTRISPREQAKNLILEVCRQRRHFSLQDVVYNTGLDAIETGYLLDELLAAGYLNVTEYKGEFVYQVTEKPLVPVR